MGLPAIHTFIALSNESNRVSKCVRLPTGRIVKCIRLHHINRLISVFPLWFSSRMLKDVQGLKDLTVQLSLCFRSASGPLAKYPYTANLCVPTQYMHNAKNTNNNNSEHFRTTWNNSRNHLTLRKILHNTDTLLYNKKIAKLAALPWPLGEGVQGPAAKSPPHRCRRRQKPQHPESHHVEARHSSAQLGTAWHRWKDPSGPVTPLSCSPGRMVLLRCK